jgi:predicted nucleic acid-binding Zn ribbon protein
MIHQKDTRTCMLCDKPVRGRSDKKFCDDYCRAAFNNELKSPANNFIRNVNNALSKNRRVLESLLNNGETTTKANRDKLVERGFQFKYHTHQYKARNGNTYFYCYEYGYLPLEKNWFLVVRKNNDQ